jgi:hypothetical protein
MSPFLAYSMSLVYYGENHAMFEDFRSLPHEQRLFRPETEPLTVVNRTTVSRKGAVPYAVKDRADFINIADNFSQAQAELYGYIVYGRLSWHSREF